jgi:hypothetical protein
MRHASSLLGSVLITAVASLVACSASNGRNQFGGGAKGSGGTGVGASGGGAASGGATASGGQTGNGGSLFTADGGEASAPCTGLECQASMDACTAKSKSPTTISGRVYDPAGAVPLYNVYVYIPNTMPDPIVAGNPTCTQCEAPASGSPVIGALTDANGNFTLSQGPMDPWGVPSGSQIPLVLQVGKWRRQLTIPSVEPCTANMLPDPPLPADKLRLPANGKEGDMPLIAFTSGCDPAECFLRHIGISDSEFVPPGDPLGHVHFYTGRNYNNFANDNASSVAGGNQFGDTYQWWAQLSNLMKYDIVFNACECLAYDRGVSAYQAMHDYLNAGGRVFSTHYYYNWFAPKTGPADFQGVVNWALPENTSNPQPYGMFYIDSSFPKGKAFADWLQAQGFTTTYGQINIADTHYDMNQVNMDATRWIYNADSASSSTYATMYMSFNTPLNVPLAKQCGRAVYSDVHLSGDSDDSTFPNECANADPSGEHQTNEKALEFLFFDLSSCVQDNSQPPPPPPPTK